MVELQQERHLESLADHRIGYRSRLSEVAESHACPYPLERRTCRTYPPLERSIRGLQYVRQFSKHSTAPTTALESPRIRALFCSTLAPQISVRFSMALRPAATDPAHNSASLRRDPVIPILAPHRSRDSPGSRWARKPSHVVWQIVSSLA